MADIIVGILNIIKSAIIVLIGGIKNLFKGKLRKQKDPSDHSH